MLECRNDGINTTKPVTAPHRSTSYTIVFVSHLLYLTLPTLPDLALLLKLESRISNFEPRIPRGTAGPRSTRSPRSFPALQGTSNTSAAPSTSTSTSTHHGNHTILELLYLTHITSMSRVLASPSPTCPLYMKIDIIHADGYGQSPITPGNTTDDDKGLSLLYTYLHVMSCYVEWNRIILPSFIYLQLTPTSPSPAIARLRAPQLTLRFSPFTIIHPRIFSTPGFTKTIYPRFTISTINTGGMI